MLSSFTHLLTVTVARLNLFRVLPPAQAGPVTRPPIKRAYVPVVITPAVFDDASLIQIEKLTAQSLLLKTGVRVSTQTPVLKNISFIYLMKTDPHGYPDPWWWKQ